MGSLDRLIPFPRRLELGTVDLAIAPELAWELVRHGDLGSSPFVRALFAMGTLARRLAPSAAAPSKYPELRLDDLGSTAVDPGFQILADEAPAEVAVGAIGKVSKCEIPFAHVPDAEAFEALAEPGVVKVAWALQLEPLGADGTRVVFEIRADATDDASWGKFRRSFRLRGPGSRFGGTSLMAFPDRHDRTGGVARAAGMTAAFLTPFPRSARIRWGVAA